MAESNWCEDLLVELECPVCTNYMGPPIRQCATGHNLCDKCRSKLGKCPICQGKFTETRNLSLEGLVGKVKYPCINKHLGCNAKLSYREKETHELKCSLRGYKCAMNKCTWIGKLDEISNHWASKNITSKPYQKSNICHTKIKAESFYVNIVNAHNKLFWFKCKLINNKLYWAVQLIGKPVHAEDFYYEIEIFKPGRLLRKILISDYCQSIDLENGDLFREGGCISINTDSVMNFITDDQLLIYYMRVNPVIKGNASSSENVTSLVKESHQGPKSRDRSKGPPKKGKAQMKSKAGFVII